MEGIGDRGDDRRHPTVDMRFWPSMSRTRPAIRPFLAVLPCRADRQRVHLPAASGEHVR